jgi:hypothetical protein
MTAANKLYLEVRASKQIHTEKCFLLINNKSRLRTLVEGFRYQNTKSSFYHHHSHRHHHHHELGHGRPV